MTTVKDASDQDALAAYVITENDTATEDLKESLKRTLPEYMVPSWIIKLDQFPMTANGKVDLLDAGFGQRSRRDNGQRCE
nr:hypothetical protein [Bacillus safensis]